MMNFISKNVTWCNFSSLKFFINAKNCENLERFHALKKGETIPKFLVFLDTN